MAGAGDILMSRIQQVISTPLHTRCCELTVLIDQSAGKELQNVFPLLVENIFGTDAYVGWGLRAITETSHPQDFNTVHHFLSPHGPFFRLIYKLLMDNQLKYEFPLSRLPMKIRQTLENPKVPPFYADLLNIDPHTKRVVSLHLNSFDYYIFNFAYHLINTRQNQYITPWMTWNTVYYMLCCDYLLHFLPTDPNCIVYPQISYYTGKNPTVIPLPSISRPVQFSKLLKTSVLQQTTNDLNTLHQPLQQHPRNEIWRSETIAQVFIDMWLNTDQLDNVQSLFGYQVNVNELPSGEYVRIIRVLVKQLHAFSASGKTDTTSMGELKKIVLPMLQGRMYVFLRNLMNRWPLEGSFRLVLELWLSFIQPWRYAGEDMKMINQPRGQIEGEDLISGLTKAVDPQYFGFMADNLLAYTVLFQQLVPRFCRTDLASPKNSLMLYRVSKVFNQPNFVPILREIESCFDSNLSISADHNWTVSHSFSPNSTNWSNRSALPVSSPNTSMQDTSFGKSSPRDKSMLSNSLQHSKWGAVIRQRIFELEGPDFSYRPLFTQSVPQEVLHLIRHIQQSEMVAREILQKRLAEIKEQKRGFWGSVKAFFYLDEPSSDEFSLEDRRKVPAYLSFSRQHLNEIFQLETLNTTDVSTTYEDRNTSSSIEPTFMDYSDINVMLTPANVRARARTITYQGDPDLLPILSSENGFLVRVLYQLASYINQEYETQLQNLYGRNDIIGKLAKQVLCPPLLIYKYDKHIPGVSRRTEKLLPPRISLRYFASHKFLFYLTAGFLITTKIFGYSGTSFVLFVFFVWFLYTFFKALFSTNPSISR